MFEKKFRAQKVMKKKKDDNYDNSFNSWINKKGIVI